MLTVPSPIVGVVVDVLVEVGANVDADQELILLESMKMEVAVIAPRAGTVTEVLVLPGQHVHEREPLVRISAS